VKALSALFMMFLAACSSHDREEASKCDLTESQLREAIHEVSQMPPYAGKRFGRCDLIVDDGRDVSVITPETQKRVEEMIANENVEAGAR
jgi:hypothetical protein